MVFFETLNWPQFSILGFYRPSGTSLTHEILRANFGLIQSQIEKCVATSLHCTPETGRHFCFFASLSFTLLPHLVLGSFKLNFSCPTNPKTVLVSTFHAGLNEVETRALHAREINRGLNQRVCCYMVWELSRFVHAGWSPQANKDLNVHTWILRFSIFYAG